MGRLKSVRSSYPSAFKDLDVNAWRKSLTAAGEKYQFQLKRTNHLNFLALKIVVSMKTTTSVGGEGGVADIGHYP